MPYVVFVQRTEPRVDFVGIAENARRWFAASAEVLGETRIAFEAAEGRAEFELVPRQTEAADLARAERAEQLGRAGGMASLAARCPTLWEVSPCDPEHEALTLTFVALLASVGLGPVMPPDGSTLFGVRGARERAARLDQKA